MAGAGLAVALLMPSARVLPWRCSCPRQVSCRGSCGFPRLGSRRGSPSSGPHLISHVYDLDEDRHATTEVPPEPWSQRSRWRRFELLGSRVARSAGAGQVAPVRLLPGMRRPPQQGSCRGKLLRPSASLCSSPWRCLIVLCWASASLRLPSFVLLCVAATRGSDCPCTRGQKESPYFCTPTM